MRTNFKKTVSLLLTFVMLLSVVPAMELRAHAAEVPVPVTTEGSTYSLFTGENLEDQYGTTFLYVIKRDGRYYTPAHPQVSAFTEVDSVAAVDITEYWDAETNTFSGIPDNANVGVMQYQSYLIPEYGTSGLFLAGNIMLSLSVPFEDGGETWFDGGIRYYDRHDTYSYSRALWEATGNGSGYFYDRYSDWMGDGSTVFGVLALNSNNRFALRNFSEEFAAEASISVNGYLYAAPCTHPILGHSAYDAPTCMDKGCEEYWYCVHCDNYFADAACRNNIGHKPVLPALDHDYGDETCGNCGQPTPVYTRITSYEQFRTVDPNASFIAVAEIDSGSGKEYYILKKEVGTADADVDEDGKPDILLVDENGNGVADILEIDADSNGVADVMDFDGIYTSEPDGTLDDDEILEYLYHLEFQYTDGYIAGLRTVGAIPVTPANDGTISVKNLGALEWIMERKIPDSELDDQYYGDGATKKDYENDFRFRIPNFWIRPVVTVSNNFYQQPYDQGDSKWWGVLFGKDAKELDLSEYRPLPVSYPDDAVVLYTEGFHSLNLEGQVEHALRFLINGGEKNFIMTSDSFWDELEGTQYPVYLYCSDAGDEVHQHVWGPWNPNTEETHKRVCTIDGCSEYELASHTPGTECTPDPENYELGHWVTCTECGGQFHEYHTREEAGRYYPNYWRDTGDGIHHVVNCTKCLGPVEYAEHDWSDWYNGNKEINGEWVRGHYRSCDDFPCEANEWQAECIYDEGVVTTAPTCLETGVMTYTCMADPACELDTKTYNEEIPALGHDWGEWERMSSNPTKEQRVCKRDPNHTEERDAAHEHDWGRWVTDGADNHKRTCAAEGCTVQTETEAHVWSDYVITTPPTCLAEGIGTATCAVCNDTKTTSIPAVADNHNFSGWESISNTQHSRSCQNAGCTASETEGHELESTVVQIETCEVEGQQRDYCETCGYENYSTRPALGHDWGDWTEVTPATETTEGLEQRVCANDSAHVETRPIPVLSHRHVMEAVAAKDATCIEAGNIAYYYCAGCTGSFRDEAGTIALSSEEITVAALGHDWGDWSDTGANAPADIHERSCKRDGCDTKEIGNHEWSGWTSTGSSEHKKTCSVCSGTRTAVHSWDSGEVVRPATQIEGGLKVYTCGSCAEKKEEIIPKLDIPVNNTPNDNAASGQLAGSDRELIEDVLTVEEKAAIADGSATVSIYLEVEDISNTVAPAEAAAATDAAAASGAQIGMYLDIDLFKDVTTAENGTDTTQITETNDKVTITIVVPDELINTDPGVTRIYKIVRVHDGWAEIIEGTFDPDTKTLTFQTDKFSTYALAYNDAAVVTYTVTYIDGVDGAEIFADQTFTVTEGTATPAFVGTPARSGYTFNGWTPAVAATVTGNATYTAVWTENNSNSGSYTPASYTIAVADAKNGTVSVNPAVAAKGSTVMITVDPDTGYTLETLTVTDKNGKEIELTSKGDGKYIFKMPASKVTVQASFMDNNTMLNFFVDVPADAYYYDAVLWAAKSGITIGTTATTFAPGNPCTRAQMVVFLWRAAGSPEPKGDSTLFTDVTADAYYAKAVQWAVENGITLGTSANTFSPNRLCTRAQMATFIYRNEQANGGGFTGAWMFLLPFTDISGWAYEPIAWCYKEGITSGTTATTFAPNDPCTRAQMVTFLYRYMK